MGRKKHASRLKEYARRSGSELKYVPVSEGPERVVMRAMLDNQGFDGVGENAKAAKESAARNALRCLSDKENQGPAAENVAKRPAAPRHKKAISKLQFENAQTSRVPERCFVDGNKESHEEAAKLECDEKSGCKATEGIMRLEDMNLGNSPGEMTPAHPQILRSILEFDSIECLGKGAFGHVFKARHKLLDKYYAIKTVRCKEKALREVNALSELNHYNIVRYYSSWLEDSGYQLDSTDDSSSSSQSSSDSPVKYLYIQMELCDTKTLQGWIDEKNTQNEKKSPRDSKRRKESLIINQQLVCGVDYIHSKKFIHRDLKPANIMFGQDGQVKIGDFGLVTSENDSNAENLIERTGSKGTPCYMAPEQKSKTYDRKVDIFPLGLIYFELLWKITTCHERVEIWDDIRTQKFPPGFAYSFTQEFIIIKSMLRTKPEDRPEASEVKRDLEGCARTLHAQEIERRISRTV